MMLEAEQDVQMRVPFHAQISHVADSANDARRAFDVDYAQANDDDARVDGRVSRR